MTQTAKEVAAEIFSTLPMVMPLGQKRAEQIIQRRDAEKDAEIEELKQQLTEANAAVDRLKSIIMSEEVKQLTKANGTCETCGGSKKIELSDPASGRTTGEWTRPCPDCAEPTAPVFRDNLSHFTTLESDPERQGGKPVLKGTRFTAAQVLAEIATGYSPHDVADDLDLRRSQVDLFLRELSTFINAKATENKDA